MVKWTYTLPRYIFKKFDEFFIDRVDLSYEMLTVDSSQSYLSFYSDNSLVSYMKADSPGFWELFELRKNPYNSLISLTYEGRRAQKLSEAIDNFEGENLAEYETYLKLKEKFEP